MSLTRRDFMAAAVAAGLSAASAEATEGLPRRVLGRTKESVTILALGCAYADAGPGGGGVTPAMVEAALEGGIRYFDTSNDYTDSEAMLGAVLKRDRDRVFIATKIDAITKQQAERQLAASLERLGTDHVDLLLQHGLGCQVQARHMATVLSAEGSLEFLVRAKRRGLARFIGMSIHAPHDVALEALAESAAWDVVMPWINYVARAEMRAEIEILPMARKRNLGVVGMKVFGGRPGALAGDYDRAFCYALSVPEVACIVIGAKSVDEVRQNVRAARAFRRLSREEFDAAVRRGEELVRAKNAREARLLRRHLPRDLGSDPPRLRPGVG